MSEPAATTRAGSRRMLLIIAFACVAPFVASFALYFLWTPAGGQVNYGTLLTAQPLPLGILRDQASPSTATPGTTLRGKWLLLIVDDPACDRRCQAKLYATRQSRTMTGKERDRVERLWLLTAEGSPPPQLLAEHPDLVIAHRDSAAMTTLLAALPADAPDAIFIVDPLDNLILRYPAEPDIRGLFKDLSRLLFASRIG